MSFLARQLITRSPSVLNFHHTFNQGHVIGVSSNVLCKYTAKHNLINPQTFCLPVLSNVFTAMSLHTSATVERARQSTRIRKRKVYMDNKKKKEERLRKNPPPLPKKIQLMLKAKGFGSEPLTWRQKDEKPFGVDDIIDEQWNTWPRLSLSQALDNLREHYHPSMLDEPNGIVNVKIEFNMSTGKINRYKESFNKMVPLLHAFERGVAEKNILVFAKNTEDQEAAIEAGAQKAGGSELIEDIAKGKIEIMEFDHFICHDDILVELKPLLGVLRDQFPKKNLGTVGTDMRKLVKTFSNGQLINVQTTNEKTLGYAKDPSYAHCTAMIGRLEMPDDQIMVNFDTLLESLMESAPAAGRKKDGGFITRAQLFVDDRLRGKFSVYHDLVTDKKYKDYAKSMRTN